MRIDELENFTTIYSPVDKYGYTEFFKHIMMNMHCVAFGFIVLGVSLM